MKEEATSYNKRQVRYEKIHHITSDQFDALSNALNLQDGDKFLDAGCGYGSATREMIIRNEGKPVQYFLLDESIQQLSGAQSELESFDGVSLAFYNNGLLNNPFSGGMFQHILVKKVIHEFPQEKHLAVMKELYRLLAPGGQLIVWHNVLDEQSQPFFQETMRKKDELAGFNTLVRNRYFPSESFFFECAAQSGFDAPQKFYEFDYRVATVDRLASELHGDISRLEVWNSCLRQLVDNNPTLQQHLQFEDAGAHVAFTIKNAIYILKKQ